MSGQQAIGFDLSSGSIHASQFYIEQVEADQSPPNLVQLLALGRLVVADADVTYSAVNGSSSGLVALPDLVRSKQPDITAASTDYERLDVSEWSREDYINYGRWLDSLTREPDDIRSQVTAAMLRRAHILGIGPSLNYILRPDLFGTITAYHSELQVIPKRTVHQYDRWSRSRFADYVEAVFLDVQNPREEAEASPANLTEAIAYRAKSGQGPSHTIIRAHAGDLTELLASRGYAYLEMRKWSRDDYIDWGVKFMLANGGRAPTGRGLKFLARARRGPHPNTIRKHFKSGDYKDEVCLAYEARGRAQKEERQQKILTVQREIDEHRLPYGLTGRDQPLPSDVLIARRAKWQLLNELLPHLPSTYLVKVSIAGKPDALIRVIQKHKDGLSEDQIVATAERLGVHEDIWPPAYLEYLRVPEDVLGPEAKQA